MTAMNEPSLVGRLATSTRILVAWALVLSAAACGGKKSILPQGTTEPDRFLFDRANQEVKDKNWINARTYFQQIVDNYPQSPFRPDAKLGVGDTYLGENTVESVVLAANEFKEFLSFYPTHARADYAQFKLAMSHFAKMRAPERDQTETRESVKEFDTFFERYPSSALAPEVRQKSREAHDRLTQASVNIGIFYFRTAKWYPGAIARFRQVLAEDPEFTRRDAVYYYLAESLTRSNKKAEAMPYFDRLLKEFSSSEFLADGKRRLEELKSAEPKTP